MPINNDKLKQAAQLPNVNGHRPQSLGDRHTQANNTAHQSTVQDKAVLANRTREQLGTLNSSLQKIKTDRNNAVEQVSDTLAYLYSPQTFQADVMRRTSEKLGLGQSNEPEPLTLDSLADCFANFANTVEYPAISPSTVAGALPM